LPSIKELLSSDKILEISQANTLGKSLEYFLYCDSEILPTLSQNIGKTVNKLIANKKWNYISIKYS